MTIKVINREPDGILNQSKSYAQCVWKLVNSGTPVRVPFLTPGSRKTPGTGSLYEDRENKINSNSRFRQKSFHSRVEVWDRVAMLSQLAERSASQRLLERAVTFFSLTSSLSD